MRQSQLRVIVQYLFEELHSPAIVPLPGQSGCDVEIDHDVTVVEVLRAPEEHQGRFGPVIKKKYCRQVAERVDVIGINADRFSILTERLVEFAIAMKLNSFLISVASR